MVLQNGENGENIMNKIPNPNKMKKIKGPQLSAEELHQAKVRITTYLDSDILSHLKTLAKESGGKYQTTLNQILRDYFSGSENGLLNRLTKLEKAVFRAK